MIKRFEVGPLGTNCYIYGDEILGETAVIDPGEYGSEIWDFITENSLKVKYIIFTHGHFDHIMAAGFLKEKTGAPICAFEKELPMFKNDEKKIFGMPAPKLPELNIDKVFQEEDVFRLGLLTLSVFYTPGHTQGSVCLYSEKDCFLFSGDTLFYETVGRCDNEQCLKQLTSAVKEKLFLLPDDTMVFPGHGESTTIGHEKLVNPYLNGEFNG